MATRKWTPQMNMAKKAIAAAMLDRNVPSPVEIARESAKPHLQSLRNSAKAIKRG